MARSTPGPWQVVPFERALHHWLVGDSDCGSIADCSPPGPWMSFEEATANARLCASAPDLLAALLWLKPYAQLRVREYPNGEDIGGWRMVLAAIERATGGGG